MIVRAQNALAWLREPPVQKAGRRWHSVNYTGLTSLGKVYGSFKPVVQRALTLDEDVALYLKVTFTSYGDVEIVIVFQIQFWQSESLCC